MAYLLIGPGEALDYACDWSDFLGSGGSPADTIAGASWSISPSGPVLSGESFTSTNARVEVSGCSVGIVYRLTNAIQTTAGLSAERSITIRCETR